MENLEKQLVDKSVESFIMGLEVYNKPTLRYRAEGFSFFICNAWELMLKAELIKRGISIYFRDNPTRTIELSKAVGLIYTDKKQPLRVNLEKIIEFRNTSTHFVTDDYELLFAPLFQSCVINYVNELSRFFDIDVSNYVSRNSLTLTTDVRDFSNAEIEAKYPPEIANKLIFTKNDLDFTANLENSSRFAINVKHSVYITKKPGKANFTVAIDKNADKSVNLIKATDPNSIYNLSFSNLILDIEKRLGKQKIPFSYRTKNGNVKKKFNRYTLQLFIDFYNMKQNKKFAYRHNIGQTIEYTYSQQAAEFIVGIIRDDPTEIIDKIKNR